MSHAICHRTEQVTAYAGRASVADDQQVGVLFLSDCEEGVRGLPKASSRVRNNAMALQSLTSPSDDLLCGHPLVDVEHARRVCTPRIADPRPHRCTDRPIGSHDLHLGAAHARQVPRGVYRAIRRRRPIGPDNDPSIHVVLPCCLNRRVIAAPAMLCDPLLGSKQATVRLSES